MAEITRQKQNRAISVAVLQKGSFAVFVFFWSDIYDLSFSVQTLATGLSGIVDRPLSHGATTKFCQRI